MLPLRVDADRFFASLERARAREKGGIGTQNEKLLHAALKDYFAIEGAVAEYEVEGFVADLFAEGELVEIQTGNFSYLRKKLPALLEKYPVTVVCPLMRSKTLFWIDPQTGELSGGRKSPKKEKYCHLLGQIYPLMDLIGQEGLRLVVFLYDGEEYKRADGWSKDGKKGSHRVERIPTEPVEFLVLSSPYDLGALLPENCPERFSAADFSKFASLRGRKLSGGLKLLLKAGVLSREKQGRSYLYTVNRKEFIVYESKQAHS
ncbi:MAG: hypothetical protein J6M12_00265 [Clostridia bacterium]|nr:hypothetical protein [Clostridia bacterium]